MEMRKFKLKKCGAKNRIFFSFSFNSNRYIILFIKRNAVAGVEEVVAAFGSN